jgi:hypothetical protein
VSWLLSLLALKLTRTRRVSHVDDLLSDSAAALLAGLAVLPKKSALTSYSYRLAHDHQRAFLAALDTKMISSGLAAGEEAIFDLDFHAVMHWGHHFAQDSGTHNIVYATADTSKATQAREAITFCDHWKNVSGHDPALLVMDQKVTTQDLDIMLAVLAQALLAALRARLPGYHAATPDVIQRRFLETPGQIITTSDAITVRLERRAYSPTLRKANLPATATIPWLGNRTIRYELS